MVSLTDSRDLVASRLSCTSLYLWFNYDFGQKYYAPQVQLQIMTVHVTETPALTTWPSVTFSSPASLRDSLIARRLS